MGVWTQTNRTIGALIVIAVFMLSFLSGCLHSGPDYIVGTKEQKEELRKLFHLLENQDRTYENEFIIIRRIIKILHANGSLDKLNLFLTTYVQNNSKNQFNAFYLLVVAKNYMEEEAYPFAVHYFERIIKNYPDLMVQKKSIHHICLKNLINLVDDPEVTTNYYKDLLARFSNEIDKGQIYYYLAKNYEKLGEWDLAFQAYNSFLQYPETIIPGNPEARKEVRSMVEFYTYDGPDWTMDSLDELVKNIKWAIYRRDVRALQTYMAKINFFTTSWEEEEQEHENTFRYHLNAFLNARIRYKADLDKDSNAQEAYLRTTGWSYRISTWYLYFRKIHFPANPERHGRWEWAGIYFGEKPFAGSDEKL